MKKILTCILILFCGMMCVSVAAEEPEAEKYICGDYEYVLLGDGTAEISGYTGEESDVMIPESLDGYSVTSIGDYAFGFCRSLTAMTIPDSVTLIGNYAFANCPALTGFTIPNSVNYIGKNPFMGCSSLTNIQVSPDHPALTVNDGVLFSEEDKRLVCYLSAYTEEEYTIPDGIQIIGDDAFFNCTGLAGITIPDSVTSIGDGAFSGCVNLTDITISDSVSSIGRNAFNTCVSLTGITLPDSVTSIGQGAFGDCRGLTTIFIPDSVTVIEGNPFRSCNSLTDIQVSPDNPILELIDGVLFNREENRLVCFPCALASENYVIPQETQMIGECAFYDCNNLTGITIPDSVESIGQYAFSGCDNLIVTVSRDSCAHQYCVANDIPYKYSKAND